MVPRTTTEIEMERRKLLLEVANVAYIKLRSDPKASNEFDDETKLWDRTLADGLE